ncbi:BF3164 family lipoprotein [Cecembia sp.]|uniref:BF3164 family lipoprotein n=1 Tax=Cecembia sp. TaxID=1898110 RepID=UPI0025BD42C5|nr:BF3164 family lipoprotein [Cecembia sp.]
MKNFKFKVNWFLMCFIFGLASNLMGQSIITKVSKRNFPVVKKIKGEEILLDDYNHHHHIFVVGDYLLTLVNSGPHNYHVFDKKTYKYLGPIGIRGEGPNEWQIPQTTLGQYEKTKDGLLLWNYDYLRGNFNKINLTKTLASKSANPIIENTIRINMREFPYFQLFQGNNGRIYATSWIYEQNRGRLKYLDPETKASKKSDLFPKTKNAHILPSEVLNSLYGASFDKHPSKDKYVQATFVFNRIDIFDENPKVVKSIVDGDNWQDNYYDAKEINPAERWLPPMIKGYDGLSVSENFIVALEAKRYIGPDEKKENESFVRVYNWDGKPVAFFEIEHDLSSIDLDEANGILYATDYTHELVLKFDINQILKR